MFMEYAARLNKVPSRQSIVVPLVALVLGAGIATGTYALVDNGSSTDSQVVVVQRPGTHTADIPGKNEATTAAAVGRPGTLTADHPNEAATAASISGEQGGIVPRGSKASAHGIPSPSAASAQFREQQLREDPHGTANQLHTR
jgi:hypothetical protein